MSAESDSSEFIPPFASGNRITIEFCDRCRWLHRATWFQTELFLTFGPKAVSSITLIPWMSDDTAGRFRVWLWMEDEKETAADIEETGSGKKPVLVWDRKSEGGFPELKVLKQRIRDYVQPGQSLGHSDKKDENDKKT
ncbi:selenoprotein w-related [Moniliophthora roreri MCA 2997]|uniref:Selenoprotein w-related n=1 Tax=Moniliophthora roreri (strain MCA 2997) TaxID=1381753 RepID=V2XE59_MONRO|nr:selenoprotein w-related [Moniliophthora roreri MCA 2997]